VGDLNSLNFLGPPKLGAWADPPLVETCHWSMGPTGSPSLVRRTPPPVQAGQLRAGQLSSIAAFVLDRRRRFASVFPHCACAFGEFVDVLVNVSSCLD